MAFFVDDDKEPQTATVTQGETVTEISYSFYQCISNGKEYKYVKEDAITIFTKYNFDKEDSMSMLESAAVNSTEDILTAAELEGGAERLSKWKAEAAAAAEEERRVAAAKAAEEEARSNAEYEAALAAKLAADETEAKAQRDKEAAEKSKADAAAAQKAKSSKPKSMFGSFMAATQHAYDLAEKATQTAIKAIDAGLKDAKANRVARDNELSAAKAKNEAAHAKSAAVVAAPVVKLTFYEQMKLNAKNAEKDSIVFIQSANSESTKVWKERTEKQKADKAKETKE